MIELPGYQVEKEIGRGGMARVYLAVQTKFGRWVALKVVAADYAKDSSFRKRFLQESRINAQLTHPNIVQVHDVGAVDDALFLVMEYLRGGDLNARLEAGMHMSDLITVAKDIGRALDYAHAKGIIHRDIKPENILFREDGSAVLTDFGIARLVTPDVSLTRAGTVVGTPQYMSPEQASGKPLDGRSDIYSLGVVFFRMLTGDVPYKADSAVAVGVKHVQDAVPRLPTYLNAFQSVIDRCLAKDPAERYQSGAELAAALDAVETDATLPNATVRTLAVTTEEIRAVGSTMITPVRDNTRRGPERTNKGSRWLRAWGPTAALSLLVLGATWVLTQEPEWVSRTMVQLGITDESDINNAWTAAQSLHQDPNQSLATIVASYERVLRQDPGHTGAQEAIAGLANQWKDSVRGALDQRNVLLAETKLTESQAAFPDDPELAALSERLDNLNQAERLVRSTGELLQRHGQGDSDAALAAIQAYQQVLRMAPEHPQAKAELADLANFFAKRASAQATAGNLEEAITSLDRATLADPTIADLEAARERIQQATTLQAAIGDLLSEASRYRAAGALLVPAGKNAAELYNRVLAADPSNVIASQGLNEITGQITANSDRLFASGDIDGVKKLLARASGVGLADTALQPIRSRLQTETRRVQAVERLLELAAERIRLGYLTEPQDQNAVSALRQVQQQAPNNAVAASLLKQIAERLAKTAEEAYAVGFVSQARTYLDLALAVQPNVTRWRELRERWELLPATAADSPTEPEDSNLGGNQPDSAAVEAATPLDDQTVEGNAGIGGSGLGG